MRPADSAPHAAPPAACAACGRALDSPLLCSECGALQPVERLDSFALLGLPRSYHLDSADLRRRYLRLAALVHPDRFTAADATAADQSMRTAAQLNRAFEVLADPLLRAECLLELAGGPTAAQDKRVPQEVLAETLMLREEIDDARAAGNATALSALRAQLQRQMSTRGEEIAALAARLPGGAAEQADLRLALNAARYYQRMLEQVT